jgi:hypothetical protein
MHFPQPLAISVALLSVQGATGAVIQRADKVRRNESTIVKYSLPQDSSDPSARAASLDATRAGYEYGPPVAGGPYYPAGALGAAKGAADLASLQADLAPQEALVGIDVVAANASAAAGKVRQWWPRLGILGAVLLTRAISSTACRRSRTMSCCTTASGPTHCRGVLYLVSSPTTPKTCCSQWRGCPRARTPSGGSRPGSTGSHSGLTTR